MFRMQPKRFRTSIKILHIPIAFSILLAAGPDPFIGRWKLNWSKSHSSGPAPKSVVRTYKPVGNGVEVSEAWVDADGKETDLDYIAAYDGKEYPVKTGQGSTISFTRPDRYTVEGASRTNGKVDYTFRRLVSKDGKTLRIEITSTDATGIPATNVLVYDKVN